MERYITDTIIGDVEQGLWFDMALRSAEGCKKDAERCKGERQHMRLKRAERFEQIAENILARV